MPADNPTTRNGTRGDDTYTTLVDRRDHAQRELDESVAIMNNDTNLMTSRLPDMAATKDQALHELTAALTALKAAERGGAVVEIERGQWGVIDAASTLCQVTGSNIAELSNLMAVGLGSFNTAVANMATVLGTHDALSRTLDDQPATRNANDGAAEWLSYVPRQPAHGDLLADLQPASAATSGRTPAHI
jgi:hypothetical protein